MIKDKSKIRSISEILIDADKSINIEQLSNLWDEIVTNRYNYPLVHLYYARDHIGEIASTMAKRDISDVMNIIERFKDLLK